MQRSVTTDSKGNTMVKCGAPACSVDDCQLPLHRRWDRAAKLRRLIKAGIGNTLGRKNRAQVRAIYGLDRNEREHP